MQKFALCIKRADAPVEVQNAFNDGVRCLIPIKDSFYLTNSFLVDRAICDSKKAEDKEEARSTLQLLPYIVLLTEDKKIFTYTRGGSGEEARLHGNYSIGVGGHVDIEPDDELEQDLYGLLRMEACRELAEEAGIDTVDGSGDGEVLTIGNFTHFIVDPTNDVGMVHLGLLAIHNIKAEEVQELEADRKSVV